MKRTLLLSGGPLHDFAATTAVVVEILDACGSTATIVERPDEAFALLRAADAGDLEPFDLVTVNGLHCAFSETRHAPLREQWAYAASPRDTARLRAFVRDGGGLLALHAAVICFDAEPNWHDLCGATWNWATSSHPPLGPVEVRVTAPGRSSEITVGIDDFTIADEVYGFLDEHEEIIPLLTAHHHDRDHPLVWTRTIGAGRVVTDVLGHDVASLRHPAHRVILERVVRWALATKSDLETHENSVRP